MAPDARPTWGELVLGLVLVAVGGLGFLDVVADPFLTLDWGADPGPSLLPKLLLLGLVVAGVGQTGVVVVRAVLARGLRPDPGFGPGTLAAPVLLILSLLLVVAGVPRLGFLATSALFCLIWLPVAHVRGGHRLGPRMLALMAVEGAVITVGLWAIFKLLIKVPLP